MTNNPPTEGMSLRFTAGQIIFVESDPGDSVFHIEQGIVEIFLGSGETAVVLAEMTSGEILGVMAVVTGSKRLASARAKTEVLCKKIPAKSIADQIKQLPVWVGAVFKEYRARLDHVNNLYLEKSRELRRLEKKLAKAEQAGSEANPKA